MITQQLSKSGKSSRHRALFSENGIIVDTGLTFTQTSHKWQ